MQTQNRFLDDIAKFVGEGVGAAMKCAEKVKECATNSGAGSSHQHNSDLESKLDRIYEMVSNSRAENEALREKITRLEEELELLKENK